MWPARLRPYPRCRSARTRTATSQAFQQLQALNGDIEGPVRWTKVWTWSVMNFVSPDTPPRQRLTIDVLGRRIDHAIGAEFERALPQRRREHVVDNQGRPGCVCDLGDLRDIEHLEIGIGRRLQEAGLGVRPHRGAPGVEIEAVDDRGGDAVARQVVLHDVEAGAEDRLRRHNVVAGLDLAHHRQRDRGHPGRGGACGLRAFELGDALFEHRHGRIGEARCGSRRLRRPTRPRCADCRGS